jgi:mRNA-degrading endonuclease RelE of RelBE toxin-antitoxin system
LWYYHTVEFIESRPFTRKLHHLAGEDANEVLKAIQGELEQKPDRGAMVPGLAGVRKARVANPGRGKGKRGGYRYLYPHLEKRRHIHLLILLDKNEQEDASEEQRKQIREWVRQVKEGLWRLIDGEESQSEHFR